MWRKSVVWFVVCLFCVVSINAQTVIENESSLIFNDKTADVSLVVQNSEKNFEGKFELELVDEEDKIRAVASQNIKIKKGKETYKLSMPIDDLLTSAKSELAWYRLRYRVGDAQGFISLSEMLKDVFELRVAAAENVLVGMNYRVRVRAIHPFTQIPIKNVKVEGDLKLDLDTDADEDELKLKAASETDADGFAVLDFKIPEKIKLDYDGDLKITGRKNGIVREIDEDLDTDENKSSVFLTTDKPIYQPEQDFKVRGLYFDSNNNVLADNELEFSIKDEEGMVLFKETVKTSEYGIASVSWKIPENAKLGNYRIEVENEDGDEIGNQSFKVSRYDLPNFSVTAKPDKTFYLPTDTQADVIVNADYLFGKPVTKGKVRVVQESNRRWNWREQKYDVEEKQSFEGETDADGKYVAKVNLNEAVSNLRNNTWQRFTDLNFAAYYTDLTTNKTEQRRFDIRVSREPIHVYVIRNNYEQQYKLPTTSYVSTFYADGTPAVCDVEIKFNQKSVAKFKTNSLGGGKSEFSFPTDTSDEKYHNFEVSVRDKNGQRGSLNDQMYFSKKEALKLSTDKIIHKPGESIKLKLQSTKKDGLVYVDVVQNWSTLESFFVLLKDGKGELKIPYSDKFKGDLAISAYIDAGQDDDDYYYNYNLIRASRGIIYPTQQNLKLDAQFSSAEYRPSEEAEVKFSVLDGIGKNVQSALGVVVFDKAIEERARTDAEFGSYFSRFYSLLGYRKSFGGITLKDLNELNLSKPISDELQLAAEIMLADYYYYPRIYRTRGWQNDAKSVYAPFFKKQLEPFEKALKEQFARNYSHPTDKDSLQKILIANGLNFDNLRDPWGNNYQSIFSINQTQNIVTLKTAGADKKFDTTDDFTISTLSFSYFTPIGEKINKAVWEYKTRTGKFIRDAETFSLELAKQDLDVSQIKDRWGRDYRITFEVAGRNYLIRFASNGANGTYEPNYYASDDFSVWTSSIDYFADTEKEINRILSQTVNIGKKPFPKNDDEFKRLLKENGLNFAQIRDGWGASVYLISRKEYRYSDKVTVENGKQKITPVTQEMQIFTIRSYGANYNSNFDLASFSSVLTEQSKDTLYTKTEIKNIAYSGNNGAIRGTVTDSQGAVVAGATITVTNENSTATYKTVTNDEGIFLIENLTSGNYKIEVYSAGFKKHVLSAIQVTSMNLVEIKVTLEVGAVQEVVTVTGSREMTLDATSASVSTTISSKQIQNLPLNGRNVASLLTLQPGVKGKEKQDLSTQTEEISTPRLREYFPETLVWQPELITDKNGKAELKFKMADNITTWKLYTIASTKNGKIGVAEREVKAFQPFFVDLDPPKFLTEGDEIYLPTQVRNYTETKQKVDVTMAKADWFSILEAETRALARVQSDSTQKIEVDKNSSNNAVFGFKTIASIKGGKQKVTAIANKVSDAIEKPVTVRPNGEEIVQTESKLFNNSATFEVNFPNNALPKTAKAELKIYPNLMAHVTESVEGLLQRPYGCGEQTISSTYPNLMILKFTKEDNKLRSTADKFLRKGYERLLGYQIADGGFSYWGGKDSSDVALTAYALRFLTDAKTFIEVDEAVIKRAQDYLIKQQNADGSFTKKYYWETSTDSNRTKLFTSYVARTLAMRKDSDKAVLNKALEYLKKRNDEIDEPYALALFGLASLDAGNTETANKVVQTLAKMAIPEGNAVYWKLETNTPFYGWGTAGRVETTALVLQLLVKSKDQSSLTQELITKGTQFLLKNKDRYGVWYSTQTTINVLDAFLATISEDKNSSSQNLQVFLNGEVIENVAVAPNQITPIVLNLAGKLNASKNRLEVKNSSNSAIMSQVVSAHYIDWKDSVAINTNTNQSRQLRLDYKCDKQNPAIMQEVNCAVETERVGFKGYGMLLAEIGIPPGADVSRESLEEALKNDWSLSRYDILPDRIVFYMWSKAGGTKFKFSFKPRYGIKAQTSASIVYDYYNEEAKATIAPLKFEVK